jgi:hypothetical protein
MRGDHEKENVTAYKFEVLQGFADLYSKYHNSKDKEL